MDMLLVMCRFRTVEQRQCNAYIRYAVPGGAIQPYPVGKGAIPLPELNRADPLQSVLPCGATH